MRFKTRKVKLENRLREEIGRNNPDLDRVIGIVEDFESDNLKTIDKLKKKKKATLNKINGALKQSIFAHGPITKNFIGSASKRIYGSILEAEEEEKKSFNIPSFIGGLITMFVLGVVLFLII